MDAGEEEEQQQEEQQRSSLAAAMEQEEEAEKAEQEEQEEEGQEEEQEEQEEQEEEEPLRPVSRGLARARRCRPVQPYTSVHVLSLILDSLQAVLSRGRRADLPPLPGSAREPPSLYPKMSAAA
eukprot:SAG22_NODE_384_length_11306_cov_12.130365_5_plen_124_part_00